VQTRQEAAEIKYDPSDLEFLGLSAYRTSYTNLLLVFFRCEFFLDFTTVIFLFIYGKYCPIIDYN